MKFYTFEIVVEKEPEDAGYSAYSPTLPGCFSNGKTIEEAKRNIREAIQQHIQSLLTRKQPIPQNERLVHVEELTVAVP
ncbi:MAG: type II toxin-antitoxin system HicB family antitoxin [Nitrospirae bacterium]|nr:MAG: type II toxin-antitoxin system HicB family antitoxin [Nitrospirota bacterium]